LLGQAEPLLIAGGRAVDHSTEFFIGIDVAKQRNAVAVADGERSGEIRYFGEVEASEESMRRLVNRIAAKHGRVHFCYEAGPTGYGLYRLITGLGHPCMVVAPSLIPTKPGDRVKTNRRDAVALAKLLRAGELTPVWVPDESHEAIRDLVRARAAGVETLRVHRQQVSAFMLKHGRIFPRKTAWALGIYGGCKSKSSIIPPIRSRYRRWWKPSGSQRSAWNGSKQRSKSLYPDGRWRLLSERSKRYAASI
jgi:transposase